MITQLAGLFFAISTLGLLIIAQQMLKRIADLEVESHVQKRLLDRCQKDIIDMGCQLFNLTDIGGHSHPGYVYVVKSDTGHYKIGRTIDFRDRARTFEVKLPVEIEFLVLIETGDCHALESSLHQQFQHKRVNGEWFNLDHGDMLWLTSVPGNILKSQN